LIDFFGSSCRYQAEELNITANTGLAHEYVDETVKNGIKYYYAVVSYDGGNTESGKELPPSESQLIIQKDPITSDLKFDVNTVAVTPGSLPSGVKNAEAGIGGKVSILSPGNSTGDVSVKVLNDLEVQSKFYKLDFTSANNYQLLDSTGITETLISKDTVFVTLSQENIQEGSFELFDQANNAVDPAKYLVSYTSGKIRGANPASLPADQKYTAKFRYYPIASSNLVKGEDAILHLTD
jgi:hypothetical protein